MAFPPCIVGLRTFEFVLHLGHKMGIQKFKKTCEEDRLSVEDNMEDRNSKEDPRRGGTTRGEKNMEKTKDNNLKKGKKELSTAAVIFVDNTKDGELAKKMREVIEGLEDILGYKVKVLERSGTPLKLI